MTSPKIRILIVGCGGIGTIAALNISLDPQKRTHITAILRSNYTSVVERGFTITSSDYGTYDSWRPDSILQTIPHPSSDEEGYDYIIVTTKNIPDVPPSLADLIAPAVTARSVIVLIQNGLNIERPLHAAFPTNTILSGVSFCGAAETTPGRITQDDHDRLIVGAFVSPDANVANDKQVDAAKRFVDLYAAAGKATCTYDADVQYVRWRKLIYNASWNPICALTGLDTSRVRLSGATAAKMGPQDTLLRPAMQEIIAAAAAASDGRIVLDPALVSQMINAEPIDMFCKPSMQQDVEKGRFIEYENILGEALREGEKAGVAMPVIRTLYGLCRAYQWRIMEAKGMVDVDGLLKEWK